MDRKVALQIGNSLRMESLFQAMSEVGFRYVAVALGDKTPLLGDDWEKHIGHISEDFSTMISREVYEEHFLPALQYCVKDCDSSMLHVHSLGERMIPVFAGIDNIKIMELSSDPNCARAVEVYRKYREELKNKTIIIAPTYEELANMGDLFETNKTIIWYYAEDEADAQRALKAVEKYR